MANRELTTLGSTLVVLGIIFGEGSINWLFLHWCWDLAIGYQCDQVKEKGTKICGGEVDGSFVADCERRNSCYDCFNRCLAGMENNQR